MNFTKAIAKFKQLKNDVDVTAFGTKVQRVLDDAIDSTNRDLKRLKEDLAESIEEQERDMVYAILDVDTSKMNSKAGRDAYAKEWLQNASKAIGNFNTQKENLENQIKEKVQALKDLKDLKTQLENIDVEKFIEKSNDEE